MLGPRSYQVAERYRVRLAMFPSQKIVNEKRMRKLLITRAWVFLFFSLSFNTGARVILCPLGRHLPKEIGSGVFRLIEWSGMCQSAGEIMWTK
jgi:hypothetical protein